MRAGEESLLPWGRALIPSLKYHFAVLTPSSSSSGAAMVCSLGCSCGSSALPQGPSLPISLKLGL